MKKALYLLGLVAAMSSQEALASWLEEERPLAVKKLMANISPSGTTRGTVIASPSRANPDYFFHWTRDAALTMDAVLDLYATAGTQTDRDRYKSAFFDYVRLSRAQQNSRAIAGLGEPKFFVDGNPYDGDWGRPQNDGPALRAITSIRFARVLLTEGRADFVRSDLYDGRLPSLSLIKKDLEYVAAHWREPSFDLWEEVRGDHFYTRMVQRKALLEGSKLARDLGDPWAADWYAAQAKELQAALAQHWNPQKGIIVPTLNRSGGADYKTSDLDSAVILAVLHGYADDGFFGFSDPRVLATLEKQATAFRNAFSVNRAPGFPGTAIGRYPEDRYGGIDFNGGNPWVLTTLAFAEIYYKAAQGQAAGVRSTWTAKADEFVARVQRHAYPDGALSEQIHRDSGFMTSAPDLTWNYAQVLTTYAAKEKLKR